MGNVGLIVSRMLCAAPVIPYIERDTGGGGA